MNANARGMSCVVADADNLAARDAAALWHPATHFHDLERLPPSIVTRAQGAWLFDDRGNRILDAIASWWTSVHGHCHPKIVEAIREQAGRLDHVMFAGFTHAPAVTLAERLLALAPPGYGKVFFADCGSAAIEVALKLSYQARRQNNEPRRTRFASLEGGYHGETLGALSVSGNDDYRAIFAPLLVQPLQLPAPDLRNHQHADLQGNAGADSEQADQAVALLREHGHELTALVLEPIVQCASKMRMHGAGFVRRIVTEAQALGIHVIADEIAVAFGRTGRLFASEWAGVSPDMMCLSKGLSGGQLPLSCVLVRAGFEAMFTGSPARSFLHSHTFTGNPMACAAGAASVALLTDGGVLAGLPAKIDALARCRETVAARCAAVIEHRQAGMIVALKLAAPAGTSGPADGRLSLALREEAMARGVLLRPLHDTIYWMPPYCIDDEALQLLTRVTIETIEAVLPGGGT